VLSQVSFDERFEQDTEGIRRGPDADQDENDREQLAQRTERVHLAETNGGHRGDGLVQGVEHAEAEDDIAEGAPDEHQPQREQRETNPPQWAHDPKFFTVSCG
jgi:hypothetical protein